MRYRGDMRLEFIRKGVHILTGLLIVLLFQAHILDVALLVLITLLFAALMLYNLGAEKELLTKVLSISRADRQIPGLDILAFLLGSLIVLLLFERRIAFAAILILSFGDAIAHLISRSFGATQTVLTKSTYLEGTVAGAAAGTLAAWLYVPFLPALLASCVAMIVEAGELRIRDHHIDDNLVIPIVAAVTLRVISLAFPF